MKNLQRNLLVVSGVVSALAFVCCILSLTTKSWISAEAVLSTGLTSHINYGLFSGSLERSLLSSKLQFPLAVVCDFSAGACMYSCQKEALDRQEELRRILAGEDLEPCEQAPRSLLRPIRQTSANNSLLSSKAASLQYMPCTLWLSAVVFHVLCAIFGAIAFAFAILNLWYSPVERIFNVFGLFVWHGCSSLNALIGLCIWAALYMAHLQDNVAITDTLRTELTFSSANRSEIGYSYHLLIVSLCLSLLVNGILLWRRHMPMQDECPSAATPYHHNTASQLDVPLEFY